MAEVVPVFLAVALGAAIEVTSRVVCAAAKKGAKVAKKGTKLAKSLCYNAREKSRKRLTAAGSNRRSRDMARISDVSEGQQRENLRYNAHEISRERRTAGGSHRRSRNMVGISGASERQQREVRQSERQAGSSHQPFHASMQPYRSSKTTTEFEESMKIRRNGTKVYARTHRTKRGNTTTEDEESAEIRRNGTKVYARTRRVIQGVHENAQDDQWWATGAQLAGRR